MTIHYTLHRSVQITDQSVSKSPTAVTTEPGSSAHQPTLDATALGKNVKKEILSEPSFFFFLNVSGINMLVF